MQLKSLDELYNLILKKKTKFLLFVEFIPPPPFLIVIFCLVSLFSSLNLWFFAIIVCFKSIRKYISPIGEKIWIYVLPFLLRNLFLICSPQHPTWWLWPYFNWPNRKIDDEDQFGRICDWNEWIRNLLSKTII